jgi:hypothetical protein
MSDVFGSIHGPSFWIDGPGMMDVLLHDAGRISLNYVDGIPPSG